MGHKISKIIAREILDSRGNPTVAVRVETKEGFVGVASVPSGASTGKHEALELRDNDTRRYRGKGVLKACRNVTQKIAPKLVGQEITEQRLIDKIMLELDGTDNKSKLGANAILGVSLAVARAGAASCQQALYTYLRNSYHLQRQGYKLPLPMMNVLNGGEHADWAIDFQECLIIPRLKKFSERVRAGSEVFHHLKDILKKQGFVTSVGDEGGYAPRLKTNEQAFQLILEAIRSAGYEPGREIALGSDIAASEFYDEQRRTYSLLREEKNYTAVELIDLYQGWLKKYPFLTIEDGLAQDDWSNWAKLTEKLGKKLTLVGDDLFVTNVSRLQQGIENCVANAILVKPNQIGTVSETMETIELAHRNGYQVAISHRSGETADTFIADLAVAVNAEFIKTGSLSRSERLEKYNRLMEIESEIREK
jgi:enolase